MFMGPFGIQEATCAVIGNCIGANNVSLAKRFFKLALLVNLIVSLALSLITLFLREQISKIFTDDIEVREMVSYVLILLSFNFLFDGMQTFL